MTWKKKGAPDGQTPSADGGAAAAFSKYKKHLRWAVPLVCVLVLIALAMARCSGEAQTTSAAPEYSQSSVRRRTISETLSTTGTLRAANTYTVRTLVEGDILSSDFEQGDIVEEGQQLYQIENSDASTNVEQAQISLEQAQRNYDRIADYRYVRSSVAGKVYTLSVKVGDEVTAGQEVAVVQDSSRMVLQLTFPSADAANFQVGQRAVITLENTFEQLDGTVTEVSGSDMLSSGNVLVRTVTITTPNAGTLNTAQAATATINGISSTGSATFSYQDERTLTASTAGTVASIYVGEGGAIAEDQILLELSGDDLEETIQNAYESLRSREISMRNAEDTLANYTITAPISGTVIQRDYQQGDSVESGTNLCIIYDLSYLEMTINIDELDVNSIAVGQAVAVTSDSIPDTVFDGVITRVSMVGTTSGGTTTYPITVQIDESGDLRPGMNVNADIIVAEADDAVSVPNAAIRRGGYVLVTTASPSAANAAAEMSQDAPEGYVYVAVTTGVSDDNYTEITGGLQEGDIVGYAANGAVMDDGYISRTS